MNMSTEDTMEDVQASSRSGHISDVGMLDLTSAKTPEDLANIKSLHDIGAILIPEHLTTALAGIQMHDVGAVIPITSGDHINMITGQTKLTGESLAAGDPETVLVIAGQVVVTTRVDKVGYKGLQIVGQVLAPRGSETALASKITRLSGQMTYYPEGARFFIGDNAVTSEFLEMLPAPTPLLIIGHLNLDSDISVDLLREKVSEIALMGAMSVPRHLAALTQFLTVEKMGDIEIRD